MNLGENIKRLRKAKGLTQGELSEKIGKSLRQVQKYEADEVAPTLSRMSISNYERGDREPQVSTMEIIAKALEVSVPELLGYEATPEQIKPDITTFETDDLLKEIYRRMKL